MNTNRIIELALVGFVLLASIDPCRGETPEPMALWPHGAPGSEERMKEPEKVDRGEGKCNVTNVHHPSITPLFA